MPRGPAVVVPLRHDQGEAPAARLKLAASSSLLSSEGGFKAAPSEEEESKTKLRRSADFDELVAPLEEIGDGRRPLRLNGPGRDWCLAAFAADPEGFAACAERALERFEEGRSQRPLGLLCQMVRAGEHLAVTQPDDAERWQLVRIVVEEPSEARPSGGVRYSTLHRGGVPLLFESRAEAEAVIPTAAAKLGVPVEDIRACRVEGGR